MSGEKTAMASRRSGSPCAGNARKKKAYKAHFNPDWVKEWPALIAKSHKGDTDAFCRLYRCDFRGFAKLKKFQKSQTKLEVGGWVQVPFG